MPSPSPLARNRKRIVDVCVGVPDCQCVCWLTWLKPLTGRVILRESREQSVYLDCPLVVATVVLFLSVAMTDVVVPVPRRQTRPWC